MSKDVFDIIAERDFHQLSKEEHSLVAEVCENEDEFVQMKQVLQQVGELNAVEQESPSPKVKESLDAIFAAQTFPKAAPIWYNKLWVAAYPQDKKIYQRPLIQVAAILLLIVGIVPMMMNSTLENKQQMAQLEDSNKTSKVKELHQEKDMNAQEGEGSLQELTDQKTKLKKEDLNQDNFKQLESVDERKDIGTFETRSMSSDAVVAPSVAEKKMSSNHPDGVFAGFSNGNGVEMNSIKLSEQPEFLDLLTASF